MRSFVLFILSTLFFYTLSAQSISLSIGGQALTNNETVTVEGNTDIQELKQDFTASLSGPEAKEVRFVRYEVEVPPTGADHFCWSVCYISTPAGTRPTWEDPTGLTIDDDRNTGIMSAYYRSNNTVGSATYRYKLYLAENPNDSISINIIFEVAESATSTQNNLAFMSRKIRLYPNPSNGNPSIQASFSFEQNHRLVLSNMLGEVVYEKALSAVKNNQKIDLSNLPAGLYFYSLLNANKRLFTDKVLLK